MQSSLSRVLHIVTPEFPPALGGVGDFVASLAELLKRSGVSSEIWAPGRHADGPQGRAHETAQVTVHRVCGSFGLTDLRRLNVALSRSPSERRVFIQWVPHGYGRRALNLAFCLWVLLRRSCYGDRIEVMIHEPFLDFSGRWTQWIAAALQRAMTIVLLGAAHRVWLSTPAWESYLRPFQFRRLQTMRWMPLANTIPVVDYPDSPAVVRDEVKAPGETLIGHFGTYAPAIVRLLTPALFGLMSRHRSIRVILLGRGSSDYATQLLNLHPAHAARLHARESVPPRELSLLMQACDLLVQPFPDGVTARRTSVLACLANGLPVVTTSGRLTESFWSTSGAVALAPLEPANALVEVASRLVRSPSERDALACAGQNFFQLCFANQNYAEMLFS